MAQNSGQQNSKFNSEQYAMILNFLEDPQNKAKVWGVPGKTEVGVAPPHKIEAWKELATIINTRFKGKYSLDHKSIADRWRTYMKKYVTACEKSSSTGFGVTDIDKKRNIHTIQAKLDWLCPHYDRMHALVGERPNVSPAATFDSGNITSEVDLNEVLRFNEVEVPDFVDEETPTPTEDSSWLYGFAPNVDETTINPDTLLSSNEEKEDRPPSPGNQAKTGLEPEDDDLFTANLETSPILNTSGKRQAIVDTSDAKKSKNDRRKDIPSISGTKNPTQARNLLAQTIQESATAKAAALLAIEEKRIQFEQMKWNAEREEREVIRKEEKEEKCKERWFALTQTMLADGKSAEEIKDILAMLL